MARVGTAAPGRGVWHLAVGHPAHRDPRGCTRDRAPRRTPPARDVSAHNAAGQPRRPGTARGDARVGAASPRRGVWHVAVGHHAHRDPRGRTLHRAPRRTPPPGDVSAHRATGQPRHPATGGAEAGVGMASARRRRWPRIPSRQPDPESERPPRAAAVGPASPSRQPDPESERPLLTAVSGTSRSGTTPVRILGVAALPRAPRRPEVSAPSCWAAATRCHGPIRGQSRKAFARRRRRSRIPSRQPAPVTPRRWSRGTPGGSSVRPCPADARPATDSPARRPSSAAPSGESTRTHPRAASASSPPTSRSSRRPPSSSSTSRNAPSTARPSAPASAGAGTARSRIASSSRRRSSGPGASEPSSASRSRSRRGVSVRSQGAWPHRPAARGHRWWEQVVLACECLAHVTVLTVGTRGGSRSSSRVNALLMSPSDGGHPPAGESTG